MELGKTLVRAIAAAAQGFVRHRCPQHAAGIAYRIVFSLGPLAIVLAWLIGLVLREYGLRDDAIDEVVDLLPVSPDGAQEVEDAIIALATPSGAIGVFSLLLFAWAATGMMQAIRTGLEAALEVEESRPAARRKLVDLALVVGCGALVIVVAVWSALGEVLQRLLDRLQARVGWDPGWIDEIVGRGFPLLLTVATVLALYRFVPARRLRGRDALAGALLTTLLLVAISLASGWVYERTTRLSVVYGSLSTALVFLYSLYLYAGSLLFGAEVAAAWSAPPAASDPRSIRERVKDAVSGLVVGRR